MPPAARMLIHPIRDVTIINFQDASLLDSAQLEGIGAELSDLVDNKNRRKLILDFTKVQFMSSSALGVLITVRKKMAAIKGDMVICSMRKDLMKVFEITNLVKMFNFAPDEERALAHFGLTTAG